MSVLDRVAPYGSLDRDASPSSYDQHPLLEFVNGDERMEDSERDRQNRPARNENSNRGDTAEAELMKRLGVSPERRIKVTPEDDARVLHRIDCVVLPLMLAVYFLQGSLTSGLYTPSEYVIDINV